MHREQCDHKLMQNQQSNPLGWDFMEGVLKCHLIPNFAAKTYPRLTICRISLEIAMAGTTGERFKIAEDLLRRWTRLKLPILPKSVRRSALPGTPQAESRFPGKVHCIFYRLPLKNVAFPYNMVARSGSWAGTCRFVGKFRTLLMAG